MGKIRKRIALFVGQPDEYYQSRFLTGFHQRMFELDKVNCDGKEIVCIGTIGGYSEDTKVKWISVDTKVNLQTSLMKDSYAKEEDFFIENGRCQILVNDLMIDRKITYHFNEV